jgi:hypothetical protein
VIAFGELVLVVLFLTGCDSPVVLATLYPKPGGGESGRSVSEEAGSRVGVARLSPNNSGRSVSGKVDSKVGMAVRNSPVVLLTLNPKKVGIAGL